MDENSAGSEIRGAGEGGKVKTDEIGDVGLGCCQLCMSGCKAEDENVYILLIFVIGIRNQGSTDLLVS